MSKHLCRQDNYSNNLCSSIYIWVISSPGRDPWMPCLASPPGICLPLALNCQYPLITGTTWDKCYEFFSKGPSQWGGLSVTLGVPGHLSIAESVSCHHYNPFRALLPHQPEGIGDAEKFCSDVTFLLVLIERWQWGTGYMAFLQYGWTPIRPGSLPWRKQSNK